MRTLIGAMCLFWSSITLADAYNYQGHFQNQSHADEACAGAFGTDLYEAQLHILRARPQNPALHFRSIENDKVGLINEQTFVGPTVRAVTVGA